MLRNLKFIKNGDFQCRIELSQEGGEDARPQSFMRVAAGDVDGLIEAAKHYGESWYQRDGAGAFFMLARKWDRIEKKMKDEGYKSILEVLKADKRAEGMIDDLRDLRRYLMLIEAKLIELGHVHDEVEKGDKVAIGGDLHDAAADRERRGVIVCVDCMKEFPRDGHGYLCPHAPLGKMETCAKCYKIIPFGSVCECWPKPAIPGTEGIDTGVVISGGQGNEHAEATNRPPYCENGNWYFELKGIKHGPWATEDAALEVYKDNT